MNNIFYNAEKLYDQELITLIEHFRNIALTVEQNPDYVLLEGYHKDIDKFILYDRDSLCFTRTKLFEAFAYGDTGVLMSTPGPGLAGILIRNMGSKEQQDIFFNTLQSRKYRTFFALTEAKKGSDATNIDSYLDKNLYLNAEKWLIGNGAVSPLGVLFARSDDRPFGIKVILLLENSFNANNCKRYIIPTIGLKGAQLSYLNFYNLKIDKECILESEQSSIASNAIYSMLKTFNLMRPSVAAIAIGQAQAMLDYMFYIKYKDPFLNWANHHLAHIRLLNRQAAEQADQNPLIGDLSSLSKAKATNIVKLIRDKISSILKDDLLAHPWFLKVYRDSYGYEYMEGTSDIQYINIYNAYRQKLL